MGSVQDILQYYPLVTMLVALSTLPAMGILGQRQGIPRCGNPKKKKNELHTIKIMLRSLYVLIHLQAVLPMEI